MTQRPRLVSLAAYLLCACGQVSTLGKGMDSGNHGDEGGVSGYASSLGGQTNTVAGHPSNVAGHPSNVAGHVNAAGGNSGTAPAHAGTGGRDAVTASKGCEPLSWYCQGNDAYQCDTKGVGAIYQSCDENTERCVTKEDDSYAFCADGCKPGAKLCVPGTNESGAFATCNADGSKPTSGTSCAEDQWCRAGECIPNNCTTELFCQGSELHGCGMLGDTLIACAEGRGCLDLAVGSRFFGAGCAALPCSPGATACVLNQVGTCAPDGRSLSQVSDDCNANGSACTVDPQCAKTVTDTLGDAEDSDLELGGNLRANVISVHSPRRLTELQSWLTILGPRQLRWVVYEQVGNMFVSKAEKEISAPASNGIFVGSGANSFDYLLEAGKTYILGVVLVDGNGSSAYDFEPYVEHLSFGVVRGRTTFPYAISIDATVLDDQATYIQSQTVAVMKLTTELP